MKTTGNTVLITGGGTGIGLALAERLIRAGNTVIVGGRRKPRFLAAKKRVPRLILRVCDVSRPAFRRAISRWAASNFRNLNIRVNNAGIQRAVDARRGPRDLPDADEEIATNLAAPIHLSARMIPRLKHRRHAAIVNISSGLAFTPLAAVPVYYATKAAVHCLSLSLRFQLKDTPVRVFEVAPPIVRTGLSGGRRRPEAAENSISSDRVAQRIMDALEHDEYEVALGSAPDCASVGNRSLTRSTDDPRLPDAVHRFGNRCADAFPSRPAA
jgi:uncharacterized oxidoreductase